MPALCREPLCPVEALPLQEWPQLLGLFRGRYPPFIAPTDSCARPPPSRSLRLSPRLAGLCRLPPAPAGKWPFPALSPQSLYRCLSPYPASPPWCTCPFLPRELRPHPRVDGFGTPTMSPQCNFNGGVFSGLQLFLNVQAPILARPPGCTHRLALCSAKGGRAVYTTQWTCGYPHELWHRYVPESGNWHGGTPTRWTAALPAAPSG